MTKKKETIYEHADIILDALYDYLKWFEEDNKELAKEIKKAIKYMESV